MGENIHAVSVGEVVEKSKILIKSYQGFVKHAPKLLRDSMMLAYTTAVDDMLKVMDSSRVVTPVKHEERTNIVLLDENGHPT